MSEINAESPQHCAKKKLVNLNKKKKKKKKVFLYSFFFSILLLIIIIFWLILHPTKPQFSLKQAEIYQLFISGTHLLNSSIQLTLVSTNPNRRVGIYYDEILLYASYKAQQITLQSSLAPFYQHHKDTALLSAVLVASALPVAPSLTYDLGRDQMAGRLVLNLKADGVFQWKVATWVSGKYRFSVDCIALFVFGPSTPLTSKQGGQCSTII